MYRTLLATCGSEEIPRFEYPSRTYNYYLPSVEPHVASNVRYIAFSLRTNVTTQVKVVRSCHKNAEQDRLYLLQEMFFSVYRLEEDVSLLKEGGVRISVWALRACSYKTKAEA